MSLAVPPQELVPNILGLILDVKIDHQPCATLSHIYVLFLELPLRGILHA